MRWAEPRVGGGHAHRAATPSRCQLSWRRDAGWRDPFPYLLGVFVGIVPALCPQILALTGVTVHHRAVTNQIDNFTMQMTKLHEIFNFYLFMITI